jgi:hypothetical protein
LGSKGILWSRLDNLGLESAPKHDRRVHCKLGHSMKHHMAIHGLGKEM